jgi:hypothetical protein
VGIELGRPHEELAAIQYMGVEGGSQDCVDAVVRLIQCRETISEVRVLTRLGAPSEHALLLTVGPGDLIAVKSGFASGYGGEGPSAFSYVLQILDDCGAEIIEYDVAEDVLRRVDQAALTVGDIEGLGRRASPRRLQDYISDRDYEWSSSGVLWQQFPPVMPFAIVDRRIMDLAQSFWDGPDERLMTGYRRLEDILRERTGSEEHSARLMANAFQGSGSVLTWPERTEGEVSGCANLFIGAFQAYRNRRAHRELNENIDGQLGEFLLLNHLFRLEALAVPRQDIKRRDGAPHGS